MALAPAGCPCPGRDVRVTIPAGVLAQVWRGGPRGALLARLLQDPSVTVVQLDEHEAKLVGELAGSTGHADVVDVHVALTARRLRHVVVTSDPDDIARVDPTLDLIVV